MSSNSKNSATGGWKTGPLPPKAAREKPTGDAAAPDRVPGAAGSGSGSRAAGEEGRVVPLRLQKFLARAGIASRRGSENLMTAGRVRVNGQVVTELGSRIDPSVDRVTVDGTPVRYPNAPTTIMLNKPAGYITTMSDPFGRPCVASLVPTDEYPGLFPVGRLDADTTGLLLFTTDGELGNRLMHPRHHVEKTYEALIKGDIGETELDRLRSGIELEDGMTLPAEVSLEQGIGNVPLVRIRIREGRKRQVRRMFEAIGHEVVQLHRSQVGSVALGDLEEGCWRNITVEEHTSLINDTRR